MDVMVNSDVNRYDPAAAYSGQPALSAGAEGRAAPRFTLLVRTAKLVADGREYLCILRDVSATGCKVRLFHPVPAHATLMLESANGEHYPMEMVWNRDDHAGFRFFAEIDVNSLIDDSRSPYPKRQIRMRAGYPAKVFANGRELDVVLNDISQQGACIECPERLMLRQSLRIEVAGFPPIFAKVCWRQSPRHGLVFDRGFLLEELALNLTQMHERAQHDSGGLRAAS